MIEDDVDHDARLRALPRIDLHPGWRGAAIIVEAFTGITYCFRPGGGEEPALLIEGFLLPVEVDQPEGPMETPEALMALVSYFHTTSGEMLHPVYDDSRDLIMHNTVPVTTQYGTGMFVWNSGDYPGTETHEKR